VVDWIQQKVAEGTLDAVQNTQQAAVRGADVSNKTVEGVADVTNKVAAGTADAAHSRRCC